MTRILFVGETWNGSSARSMRYALATLPGVELDDIGEDSFLPKHRLLILRGVNRVLLPLHRHELSNAIEARIERFKPDVLIAYKGWGLTPATVRTSKSRGIATINIFPDCSPHAHGTNLKKTVGEYDLVISTKPYHPANWRSIYGYSNPCVCVPHGYDPAVHLWTNAPSQDEMKFDVALAATWRPQYDELIRSLNNSLGSNNLRVAIVGAGWSERRASFPRHWTIAGPMHGRAYGEYLRDARIVIAPVHRELVIDGKHQPGDEDSTRTYELAAAHCFFLHRRTPFVSQLYDEEREVPLWDTPEELAALIRQFLPDQKRRMEMAAAAHARAVPAYSIQSRAAAVLDNVRALLSHSSPGSTSPQHNGDLVT